VTREGDRLLIRIPIGKPTPSASGKTLVVASTRQPEDRRPDRRQGPLPRRERVRVRGVEGQV